MLNLRFTAGVGVGISGACGPPLVWRARKPLPSALRSSAALALGLARQRAPVPERVFRSWVSACVSHRGLFSTNHRLSLADKKTRKSYSILQGPW